MTGERLASSLSEVFQRGLAIPGLSPTEREVLERAVVAGRIDSADYEAAHLRYAQCMNQHGFHPNYRKTSVGLYVELPYSSIADQSAFDSANSRCSEGSAVIEAMYRVQQANPELFADRRVVAVYCLKKGEFVDPGYTVEEFDRDYAADALPFDPDEAGPNDCLYGAGYAYFTVSS